MFRKFARRQKSKNVRHQKVYKMSSIKFYLFTTILIFMMMISRSGICFMWIILPVVFKSSKKIIPIVNRIIGRSIPVKVSEKDMISPKLETVGWINKIILVLWKESLRPFMSGEVKEVLKQNIIKDLRVSKQIFDPKFIELDVGLAAPLITSINSFAKDDTVRATHDFGKFLKFNFSSFLRSSWV